MTHYTEKYECPRNTIETTLKLISKKWNLQIIHEMFFNKTKFNEFKENKPDLDNKTLSRSLKELQKNDIIEKRADFENNSTEYYLTKKGRNLNKVIYEISVFAIDNDNKIPENDKKLLKDKIKQHLNC